MTVASHSAGSWGIECRRLGRWSSAIHAWSVSLYMRVHMNVCFYIYMSPWKMVICDTRAECQSLYVCIYVYMYIFLLGRWSAAIHTLNKSIYNHVFMYIYICLYMYIYRQYIIYYIHMHGHSYAYTSTRLNQ